jgi:RimJ/RimL family protein N-acetyltransferase
MDLATEHVASPGLSSNEREFASLVGELRALEEDIAAARATAARARAGLGVPREPKRPAARLDGERVRLQDGAEIVIRSVEPHDAPLLELGLEHLSAMSRYRRFRSRVQHLGRDELAELTDVDHRTREALGALDPSSGEGIGIARYVRDPHDSRQAEVTYVVVDAWQHRGVGKALLERLAKRALAVGVERVTATTLVGNVPARRLLAHVADTIAEHRDGGIVELTARLRRAAGP